MNINIKAVNFELTPEINDYLNKKLSSLDKFVKEGDEGAYANVELGKSTNRRKNGNIFFTEINFKIDNEDMRVRADEESLIASMDKAKDKALEVLRERKGRKKDH